MNAEQLWETTLNPAATRTLRQVTIENAAILESIYFLC
jgi:DNA gyrase/topoisomerase IV subunit B